METTFTLLLKSTFPFFFPFREDLVPVFKIILGWSFLSKLLLLLETFLFSPPDPFLKDLGESLGLQYSSLSLVCVLIFLCFLLYTPLLLLSSDVALLSCFFITILYSYSLLDFFVLLLWWWWWLLLFSLFSSFKSIQK